MSKDLDISTLKIKALEGASILKKYSVIIFIVVSMSALGFMIFRINALSNREPSDSMVNEKSNQNQNFNIDDSVVKKIEELKETNVDVKAIFEQTRDNPFQE